MHPLETYLHDLREVRYSGEGVPETSYYPALKRLLDEVGRSLTPRVTCIINIRNRGAGLPDGGLFTADQVRNPPLSDGLLGQIPARGVIEVKSTADDAWLTATGPQVTRYWGVYRQVLVTNLRDFVLVGQDAAGRPVVVETYRIAESEAAFWQAVAHPRATTRRHGERFIEFLRRVMLYGAPLATPRDVAAVLASYAREARARIESMELDALAGLRRALEETLGLTFEGERGDHFFRSTLVQTLFYGVFASWVLWGTHNPPGNGARFNWREAAWYLRVPVIGALFAQVASPNRLGPLGLVEVLDWAGDALNRVDRASFDAAFEAGQAVQYFYEPFLEAFDPELRKELGVWYTPPEVVRYMVARVDAALREELGIADGLADPRVYVLDPCTGTGSYLVEVIRRIAATLAARGRDALYAEDVKRAALERVFGFEILPAPLVVAHLQVGLLLQSLGAPLSQAGNERAAIYLTNALTGWEQPSSSQPPLFFLPELAAERDAAARVKRETRILVVLGNPPYNGYAGVAVDEERALTEAYRTVRRVQPPQGQGLNDLYVRFFRMAERRIVEQTGEGIVCFITNYSWLDGLSFTGMREHYLEVFDAIWIDSLNGDKYRTGKLTPDGKPDPSIFSTEWNREGIQVGTAIALLVRRAQHTPADGVRFRNLWGVNKRATLLATAESRDESLYQLVKPSLELGLPFTPARTQEGYFRWPALPDLFPKSYPGVKTSRDEFLVDIDRDRLVRRMEQYFDPAVSHEEMRRIAPGAMQSTKRFNAEATRDALRGRGFLRDNVVRYCYRPFDLRWLYWEPETKLLDEKRADYFPHVFEGNVWLSAGQRNRKDDFYQPQVVSVLADHHIVESNSAMFPLFVRPDLVSGGAAGQLDRVPNLSPAAVSWLRDLFGLDPVTNPSHALADLPGSAAEAAFYHTVAILHAPRYRADNAGALRQDWPRIPLPASREALRASADLGRQVAALLDPEQPVPGVTSGALRPELQAIAVISRVGGGTLDPAAGDLALTAGWGHTGRGGITMPARGRAVERDYTPEERDAIARGAAALGLDPEEALTLLGRTTYDVYLNERAYWANVPARVWDYTLGGYQVLKKWLSYREERILGRPLRPEEVREVAGIARRIAALLLLQPALDANYAAVTRATYPWPQRGEAGAPATTLAAAEGAPAAGA
ncbi:MAG: N-6 DNA methylase [Sphaerobacter sp.]|nr:N-6 DNA methylase [Sphaerobacter sp.]